MRYQILMALSIMLCQMAFAQNKVNLPASFQKPILDELKPFYSPSEGELRDLLKGDVISEGKVTSPAPKAQQLMLFVSFPVC